MSVTYEAKVQQARWLAGARVVVDLKLQNSGAGAVDLPDPMYRTSAQPHFEVTGPGGRKQEFRPNSRATDWDRAQAPTLIHLAPGGHWEGDLALSVYANLAAPGKYTLRSWIEHEGARIESPPSEFEIVRTVTESLALESSRGEENTTVVECVELLTGGSVASSILQERDAGNGELGPFDRVERGTAGKDAVSILAPYANFQVGLSALRWIITVQAGRVAVGHNLTASRVKAFGGAELASVLRPVATKEALYLAAVRGTELVLERIAASESGIGEGHDRVVEKFATAPAAAAITLSPVGAAPGLLAVLAWSSPEGMRVELLAIDLEGKIRSRSQHTIEGFRPMGVAAVGWSTANERRASVLVRSAAKATEARVVELRIEPDLSLKGKPTPSSPVILDAQLYDTHMEYFEASPGQLRRMVLLRSEGGKVWVIAQDGAVRTPAAPLPSSGPIAILPGQVHWYGVWPDKDLLTTGVL
jgi:hypothetical protein